MADQDLRTLYKETDGVGLAALVRQREVSAVELAETAIALVEDLNPKLNAVIHRTDDIALAAARATDAGDGAAPLAGVPFLLKELASSWAGVPLTNSSAFLKDVVADADSGPVKRIKAAGLSLIGKSNAPENGWSIATEPKLYGATVNPWDASVTPGGSSGGSAAAVAAGIVPIAEASDGAGSIRVPASCCGLVGLKPSRGRVSLAPFVDYWCGGAYFLCVSRTVRDTATYLDALSGGLPGEPYTPPEPGEAYASLIARPPRPLRVAVITEAPHGRAVDADVAAAVRATGRTLEAQGHHVEPYAMKLDFDALWRTYTDMTCVETAGMYGALAGLVGHEVREDEVEPITWAIIQRGRATDAIAHAGRIEQLRQAGRDIATELAPYDIVLTPTLTQPPRPVGYYDMSMTDLDAYNALWTDAAFTFPFNISGQPAMSLPLGQTGSGLPVGVQLIGRYGHEQDILQAAALLETEMPWRHRRPGVYA
ncbi:amidase [Oceaniglobus trochenteri]|uniref:amidase n=1 Tax=Oceaniglobus trochenteri TaxID=2763260 RepID=UPI001CFFDE48|nr:amidase [Oceaniglobus trochenteri]